MCRFIESIRIEQGEAPLLPWHQQRMNACMDRFYPGSEPPDLRNIIQDYRHIQERHKLRLVYDDKVRQITCRPYEPVRISGFHLVNGDNLNYSWKYEDRSALEKLKADIPPGYDIIIVRKGEVTDSSYANLAFKRNDQLYTPSRPLLKGCRRSMLLANGIIKPAIITPESLKTYDGMYLINGMLNPESASYYEPIFH